MTMAEMALRFIYKEQVVSTIIPGMRKLKHVESNIATSNAGPLNPALIEKLKKHRWDREPTEWSQ
jgi:aryl-alcohol dehydrogenase-like predicted oxidoreductase